MYNEQTALQQLGIESWRNLSKDKFKDFIAMMPDMSDETRMKIIEQLPQFTQLCNEWMATAKETYQQTLDANEKVTVALIEKIDSVRECISKELSKNDLTFEERKFIMEQLMGIAELYNKMDERSKEFFDTIFGKVLIGLGSVLGVVVLLVGGKFIVDKE
jgi:hypothetical protein